MKQRISYIFTGVKETCTGCGACIHVCKHHALSMKADNEGFLFPQMDVSKCVGCGLCDMICPSVRNHQENEEWSQHCYIATTGKKEYYKESASIGICTMLSHYVISQKGHVFGAYLDETSWTAYHIKVTDKSGVDKIRNSKYLQSSTGDTFMEVKNLLTNGDTVFYIGTPCQIAGLKAFLHREYENLYTVDIICHGVFSPKLMKYEVEYWEKIFRGQLHNFRFRSKRVYKHVNGGMVNFDLIEGSRFKHIERFAGSSPTYRCYAYSGDGNNYNLRLSCYNCTFKSLKRYADITVGDPWFIKNQNISNPKLRSDNVIRSLYSVNTAKGNKLARTIRNIISEEEIAVKDAFCQPAVVPSRRDIPFLREELYSKIDTTDYGSLVESLLSCDLNGAHACFVKDYRKKCIKTKIRKLIKLLHLKW